MAFTLSNQAQNIWDDLGKVLPLHKFLATNGSATMIENTQWGSREDAPEDDYARDWTAVVVRDAGGAGASPEGKMSRITAYNSSTYQYTIDTVTDLVAAGDEIMIANGDIPLREMIWICNRALTALGDIALVDTSLTSANNQTEYTFPVALKRGSPIKVEYQGKTTDSDDNQWIPINASIEPAAPGSTSILRLPQLPSGRTIRVVYNGVHPALTTYSSVISETIHPELAIAAGVFHAIQWLNGTQAGGTQYNLQRENAARADLDRAKIEHPIWKLPRSTRWLVSGGVDKDYPPQPFIYEA